MHKFDGAQGLVDLSWTQRVPPLQQDDIDKDPLYNQYPYQEADDYEDEEEDMEVDDWVPGNARVAVWPPQLAPDTLTTVLSQPMLLLLNNLQLRPVVAIQIRIRLWRWVT